MVIQSITSNILAGFVVYVYDTQQVGDNTQLVDLITHGQSQFKTATTDGISIKCISSTSFRHSKLTFSRFEP